MRKTVFITCYSGILSLIAAVVAIIFSLNVTLIKVLLIAFVGLVAVSVILDSIDNKQLKTTSKPVRKISTKHSYHPNADCSIAYKISCRRSQRKRRQRARRGLK